MTTATRTYATMEIPMEMWAVIRDKLMDAGYDQAFMDNNALDMHGIAIVPIDESTNEGAYAMLNFFQRRQYEWSKRVFGDRPANGPLKHLQMSEVDECIEKIDALKTVEPGPERNELHVSLRMEYADCYLLLQDAISRSDMTIGEVIVAAHAKHLINEKRQWGAVNEHGFSEHVRSGETDATVTTMIDDMNGKIEG